MRRKETIEAKAEEMFERTWYQRHRQLGSPAVGEASAFEIECRYGKKDLSEDDERECTGAMMALRWVLGSEWNFRDT